MISLFSLAADDQSVAYLGQIFGYVGSVLPVKNPPLLVGILFKTLNTMALTIGAILVIYVVVVGLFKTADEGEFLGRQWNSIWVPLRTVMGIAALFPTATGYSAIQVIIMWIVLQGVGAADVLWTKVLEYVNVAGSPYSSVGAANGATAQIQLQPMMQGIFQGLVCQASAKASYSPIPLSRASAISSSIRYYCADSRYAGKDFCADSDADMLNPVSGTQVKQVKEGTLYQMGPSAACGSITLCDQATLCAKADPTQPDSTECIACKTQRSALQSIIPVLGAVARQIVIIDNVYARFHESQRPPVIPPGILSSVVSRLPVSPPVAAPDWAKNYCADKNVPPAECCVYEGDKCTSIFPPAVVGPSDIMNTSHKVEGTITPSGSATELYLAYPLGAYLNGSDFINAAIGEYLAALIAAVSADIQKRMNEKGTTGGSSSAYLTTAKKYGWIMAGIFYYKIAGENQKDQEAIITVPGRRAPDNTKNPLPIAPGDASSGGFRSNYEATGDLLKSMTNANSTSSSFTATPGMTGDISNALSNANAALLKGWMNSLSGTGTGDFNVKKANPLIAIASFGYMMMSIAKTLFVVLTTAATLLTILATLNPIILGNGLSMNPFGEGIKAVLNILGPFFVILVSALFSIGAMLGIYVPLIPFMIFSLGAIGWLIATIEAMVAGPIIALGILSPGGQHDILGRAEPALMQIFNLFLRPSLMIIGMMISMLLSIVVMKIINAGFAAVALSVSAPSMVEEILLISVYTSFVVTGMNKAFSLIYVIPERILTFLGQAATTYGEEQAMGASKQALESAASTVSGAGKESSAASSAGAEKVSTAKQTKDNKDEIKRQSGGGQAQITEKGKDT